MMDKLFCLLVTVLLSANLYSQSWNPFVNQASMSPNPMLPVEYNGSATGTFTVGNSGSSIIPLVPNQEMGMVISLASGVPDNNDPLAAISGTWAHLFDWVYFPQFNSFVATQNQDIPGQSSGTINIAYRATVNTPQSVSSNGFNVNIQPPPFTNGYNDVADDAVSAYTYVRAIDFGDAPLSYGNASHEINLFKVSGGNYNRYVYLGQLVDPEDEYFDTIDADGDDNDGVNDEDGVIFGELIKGANATIQVTARTVGSSFGFISAWIDWNGDGDFLDVGERIITNQIVAGGYSAAVNINVPETAIAGHTYARFRIGPSNLGPSGQAIFGEVEDYKILILDNIPGLIHHKTGTFNDEDGNGFAEPGETITYQFTVYNSGNQTLTNLEIEDPQISVQRIPVTPSQLLPGESGTAIFTIEVSQEHIESGGVYNLATVYGTTPGGVEISIESTDPNPLEESNPDYNPACPTCTFTKLLRANRLSGVVWEDMNGNGVRNIAEPLLSGINVRLYTENNDFLRTVVTDTNGFYELTDLNVGNYYLKFTLPEGYEFTFSNQGDSTEQDSGVDNSFGFGTTGLLELTPTLSAIETNAGLYRCTRHSGYVWYDADENNLRDAWDEGINNVQVALYRIKADGNFELWETVTTSANPANPSQNGYFDVCTPPGFYYLQFPINLEPLIGLVPVQKDILGFIPLGNADEQANDSDINFLGRTELFNVLSGGRAETIGAGYYTMATAGSIVWFDENQNGLLDNGESGLGGVGVEAYNEQHQKVRQTSTAEDGSYNLDYLLAGAHYIKFIPPAQYSFAAPVLDQTLGNKVTGAFGAGTTNLYVLSPGQNVLDINAALILGSLPVNWIDVRAKRDKGDNVVQWSIASEENVEKYEVYRSMSAVTGFDKQGDVNAIAGGKSGVHNYEWRDTDASNSGIYYYYIENLDFDGKRSRSRVVSVQVESETSAMVYPNPAIGVVNVRLMASTPSKCSVSLFTQEGKLVKKLLTNHSIESQDEQILNLEGVDSGMYLLNITIGDKEFDKKLIIIK